VDPLPSLHGSGFPGVTTVFQPGRAIFQPAHHAFGVTAFGLPLIAAFLKKANEFPLWTPITTGFWR
jgi:hypothetical protein